MPSLAGICGGTFLVRTASVGDAVLAKTGGVGGIFLTGA